MPYARDVRSFVDSLARPWYFWYLGLAWSSREHRNAVQGITHVGENDQNAQTLRWAEERHASRYAEPGLLIQPDEDSFREPYDGYWEDGEFFEAEVVEMTPYDNRFGGRGAP